MNPAPHTRQRPAGTGRVVDNMRKLYAAKHTATRLPADWRERLARLDAATYYAQRVAKLGRPNSAGWAQGRCPFHEDRNDSLSVHVAGAGAGGWRCFAGCGSGDLVSFHRRATGLPFLDAVRDLLRGFA